jgi:hypothetical protein
VSPVAGRTWSERQPAPCGGFAPATPLKTKTKTFLRRKTQKQPMPSRWSGSNWTRQGEPKQNLPEPASAR